MWVPRQEKRGCRPPALPAAPLFERQVWDCVCPPQGWAGGGRGGLWTQGGGAATLKMAQISVQMTSLTPSGPLGARVLGGSGHGECMERAQRGLSVTLGETSLVGD